MSRELRAAGGFVRAGTLTLPEGARVTFEPLTEAVDTVVPNLRAMTVSLDLAAVNIDLLARLFEVPRTCLDADLMRAEAALLEDEPGRWESEGGTTR